MSRPRTARLPALALAAILLGGLGLRLSGIDFGRPYVYHPDEWVIAKPAMQMVAEDSWQPGIYLYPSALVYAERVLVAVGHVATGTTLETAVDAGPGGLPARGTQDFLPVQYKYVLAGRVLVAILGALTALLVFLAARRLTGVAGALVAAAALAIMPTHVVHSHYLATDVPTGAATALTLWLALEARDRGPRWLVLAGFTAGIAASTKYNGGLALVVPLTIHLAALVRPREVDWRGFALRLAQIIGAAVIGFVVLTPAVLFDTRAVLDAIALQAKVYTSGHAGAEGDSARYYLEHIGLALGLLAALGIAVGLVRRTSGHLALLAFTAAYFVVLSIPMVRFSRNLEPLVPFLAVLAGIGIGAVLAGRSRWRITAAIILVALAGVSMGATTIRNDQRFHREDTRTRALAWIFDHLPAGSVIVREDFTPQVPSGVYRVGFAGILSDHTIDFYRSIGARYLVASSAEFERFTKEGSWQKGFYERLLAMRSIYDEAPTAATTGPRIVIIDLAGQ